MKIHGTEHAPSKIAGSDASSRAPDAAASLAVMGIDADVARNRRNQWDNAFSIGIPLIGTILFCGSLHWSHPSGFALAFFTLLTIATSLGVGLGHHRYFVHRSFKTSRSLHWLLALFATVSMQGSIARWVADHRRHHRFADRAGDPHSPYFDSWGKPIAGVTHGLVHAHLLWMFTGLLSDESRYAPDIAKDPVASYFSSRYWLVNLLFCIAIFALCVVAEENVAQSLQAFLLVAFVRVIIIHQTTWSVNSFGHCFGWRVAGSVDRSTNNWLLALVALGEGLHSAHHANPTSGVNQPHYLDAGGALLRLLEKMGLVWQLRR